MYVGRRRGCTDAASLRGCVTTSGCDPAMPLCWLRASCTASLTLCPSEIPRMQPSCSSFLVRHGISLLVLPCSFDESCKSYLRPKQLSMGSRRCHKLVQGVSDSLTPWSVIIFPLKLECSLFGLIYCCDQITGHFLHLLWHDQSSIQLV